MMYIRFRKEGMATKAVEREGYLAGAAKAVANLGR